MKLTLLISSFGLLSATASELRATDAFAKSNRRLATVKGACTSANFAQVVGGLKTLTDLLGVSADELQGELTKRCESAAEPTTDFVDSIGKGPQFLKSFFDGATEWNDYVQEGDSHVLSADAKVINDNYPTAKTVAYKAPDGGANEKYPGYHSNFLFYGEECRLGVIECCYKDTRLTDTLIDNAEMCALDMTPAKRSNHINSKSWTVYEATEDDKTYCTGFAYEENSFEEKVMFNTLYHVAFKEMLMTKGYVKNIPGAPMCGCIEQMPIITNAACTKVVEGYIIDESNGKITLDLNWEDCGEGLYEYYSKLESKTSTEDKFVKEKIVGDDKCYEAVTAFMNEKMYIRMGE